MTSSQMGFWKMMKILVLDGQQHSDLRLNFTQPSLFLIGITTEVKKRSSEFSADY
jgi:hypothetical protein